MSDSRKIEVVDYGVKVEPQGARDGCLWVDDCKPAPEGFAVARNYDDAVRMMRRFAYAELYLDHDLGEDGRTGYDLLLQMRSEGRLPPRVECISWNPAGRKRILAALAEKPAGDPQEVSTPR